MPLLVGPLHREVRVRANPIIAFDWFTVHIGRWWPRVFSAIGGALSFQDGQLEETNEEDTYVWGEVITWERPRVLSMTWRHPKDGEDQRTNLEIRFVADGDITIVRVVHSGWERLPHPAVSARLYSGDRGWREVLGAYEAAVAKRETSGGLARGRSDG